MIAVPMVRRWNRLNGAEMTPVTVEYAVEQLAQGCPICAAAARQSLERGEEQISTYYKYRLDRREDT